MLFSSNLFIFLFLPIVLIGYYLMHKPYRNFFLMFMSLIFYAWGEPRFVLVMMASIIFNYLMALLIDRFRFSLKWPERIMIITVIGNIGVLFVYKYLGFFTETANLLGFSLPIVRLTLPIGISFFTFQAMSYVIDVYREQVAVQKNLFNVGLYVSFFPQLIAGPIVRYQTIEYQIEHRVEDIDVFCQGVNRFIIGLSKKIILANNMALIADGAFGMPNAERSVSYAWLGALAYSFQILFDFSGYSDMAIGLGKMFGFHFLENFNNPYMSKSVSEFWRRWHMSLGEWFRDYVYIPLGGSRVKIGRLILNLLVVWVLTGAWHGASWNFILWGFLYFLILTAEKISGYPAKFKEKKVISLIYRIFTLFLVLMGWVLFRSADLGAAVAYASSMFRVNANSLVCTNLIYSLREYWLFFVISIICSTDIAGRVNRFTASKSAAMQAIYNFVNAFLLIFCFLWCISFLILGAHNPFIYFDF